MAVTGGLCHSAISRLKDSHAYLSPDSTKVNPDRPTQSSMCSAVLNPETTIIPCTCTTLVPLSTLLVSGPKQGCEGDR
jgi:hypothetical protein